MRGKFFRSSLSSRESGFDLPFHELRSDLWESGRDGRDQSAWETFSPRLMSSTNFFNPSGSAFRLLADHEPAATFGRRNGSERVLLLASENLVQSYTNANPEFRMMRVPRRLLTQVTSTLRAPRAFRSSFPCDVERTRSASTHEGPGGGSTRRSTERPRGGGGGRGHFPESHSWSPRAALAEVVLVTCLTPQEGASRDWPSVEFKKS